MGAPAIGVRHKAVTIKRESKEGTFPPSNPYNLTGRGLEGSVRQNVTTGFVKDIKVFSLEYLKSKKNLRKCTWDTEKAEKVTSVRAMVCVRAQSCPTLCDPWTTALQSPLSMEFSKQAYWNGLPFPTPGESSQHRDRTHISYISCTGRQILYH